MDIRKSISAEDEEKLRHKMSLEYQAADNYTKEWKARVANVKQDYLIPRADQDKVKVKMILNIMKMKRSVFKTDDETVTFIPDRNVKGQEIAENGNIMAKYLFKSMGLRQKKGKAMDDDTLMGVGCLAVDGYNVHKQEPIVSYIDSRLTFPDPSNSEGSCMRFFGTLLQKTIYELEADNAYDADRVYEVRMQRNEEIEKVQRDNGNYEGDVGEDLVSIYNHITIFKKEDDDAYYKYLTTWDASKTKLLRIVKMQPLSPNEIADPSQITLGVTLYRGVPIPGQYEGASAIDETGEYQDLITLITNLQVQQALRAVVGGKTVIDSELGIDEGEYALMDAGEVITANKTEGSQTTIQNGIYKETPEPTSPVVDNTVSALTRFSQEATLQNSLVQGQSLSGAQTKSEVQTIQQNTNQILSGIASEYMESSENLWVDIMRSFQINMSTQRVKEVALIGDDKRANNFGFKKAEFVPKGDLNITISSKSQEDIKNKQDYAIMLSLDATMSGFLEPNSTEAKVWKRTLLDKSGVKGLEGINIVQLTSDEITAYANLSFLNENIDLVTKPKPGEKHQTFITIYRTGVPTKARDKAIRMRQRMLEAEPKEQTQPTETQKGAGGGGLGASMIASDNAQGSGEASLADIAI